MAIESPPLEYFFSLFIAGQLLYGRLAAPVFWLLHLVSWLETVRQGFSGSWPHWDDPSGAPARKSPARA